MRLIDADALKKSVPNTHVDIFENCRNCELLDDEQVEELIDNAPTIDAVPVVRCKDCKYYEPYKEMFTNKPRGDGNCTRARMTQDGLQEINCEDDEFCSYGERKDDE